MKTAGFIALIGRPNTGKSTLLNQILGKKASITSRKAQTTRRQILGIKTSDSVQSIYCDTPGVNLIRKRVIKRSINQAMNRAALQAINDVDIIVWLVEAFSWQDEDQYILNQLKHVKRPIILVINKVDKIKDKTKLLTVLQNYAQKHSFAALIPISAEKGEQVDKLEQKIASMLPETEEFLYPPEMTTDTDISFQITEIIREKMMRLLGDELPYSTRIQLKDHQIEQNIDRLEVIIWVEQSNHKAIVIGKGGAKLKQIGTAARADIEQLLGKSVYCGLWVKVLPANKRNSIDLSNRN